MRQPRWLKHKDSVSAVLISCAALLLSALSYSQIVQIEEGSSRAIASIQMGSTHFGLFSSNRCIGTLLMDLRMEDVLFLSGQMELRGKYEKQFFSSKIDLEASFNPLYQMNNSSLIMRGLNVELKAHTIGVKPLYFHAEGEIAGRKLSKTWEIPGPITLKRSAENSEVFRAESPGLPTASLTHAQNLLQTIMHNLGLSLDRIGPSDKRCSSNELSPLDLTTIVHSLKSLYQPQFLSSGVKHD